MADRPSAIRTIVEAMWEHAEESTVSDIDNPLADYTDKNGRVLLGTTTLAAIVRTLKAVRIDSDEVLAAVTAWAGESDGDELPKYRADYLAQWQQAVANA